MHPNQHSVDTQPLQPPPSLPPAQQRCSKELKPVSGNAVNLAGYTSPERKRRSFCCCAPSASPATMPKGLLYHRARYPICAIVRVTAVVLGKGNAAGGNTAGPGAGAAAASNAAIPAGTPPAGFIAGMGGAGANPATDLDSGIKLFAAALLYACNQKDYLGKM